MSTSATFSINQKGIISIFLIIAIMAVAAVAIFGVSEYLHRRQGPGSNGQGWGQRPGGAQDFGGPPSSRPRWSGPIPKPPNYKITYYKGLWAGPWFYPEEYCGQKPQPEKYKTWGVNIVSIEPGFEINKKGEVRYPPDFPTYEDMDARIGELTTKFYQTNIHVGLVLILTYKEEFSKGQEGELWAGEPQPFPREVVEKPGYLDQYNKVVEDMAKIAEKYHIYMFSPASEVENIFGMKVSPLWLQKIIPFVKKHYAGKLYYKGDLHKDEGDIINFKGYDMLGMVFTPIDAKSSLEKYRESYDADMDRVLAWAKRDGVPEVVISEHGYLGNNIMDTAEHFRIALEEANKKLSGAFMTEPIPAVYKTNQGKEIEDVLKKWWLK